MDITDTRNFAHLIRAIDGIHPGLYRAAGSWILRARDIKLENRRNTT
jgi:hypothetical protein